ncbi:ABC transporter permease [Peribacillus sp. NPDC058002]|uniref:ABC transporter permease n=1 Tax=Peribacillus sp. NPDC058002 TaxID=3346301 RepID=UPI0036D7AA7F
MLNSTPDVNKTQTGVNRINKQPHFIIRKWNEMGNAKGLITALLTLVVLFSFQSEYFLTQNNIISIIDQITVIGIISLAMTFVILSGGIDLSVGSIVAMSGVLIAYFISIGMGMYSAALLGVIICAIFGAIAGILITTFHLQPFIVTLGTMGIATGIAMVLSESSPIPIIINGFNFIGSEKIGIIPIPVIIFFLLIVLSFFTLKKTKFGEYTFAIGGNEEAVRLAGVSVNFYKILIYSISGLAAGFTGYIMASKFTSGVPTIGQGYELDAIAAVVIGGTALSGGIGGIGGTLIGVTIMGVLNNGLNLMGVSTYWQFIIKGLLVIVAVMIDSYSKRKG